MENLEETLNKILNKSEDNELNEMIEQKILVTVALLLNEKFKEAWSDHKSFVTSLIALYNKNKEFLHNINNLSDKETEWMWVAMSMLRICAKLINRNWL